MRRAGAAQRCWVCHVCQSPRLLTHASLILRSIVLRGLACRLRFDCDWDAARFASQEELAASKGVRRPAVRAVAKATNPCSLLCSAVLGAGRTAAVRAAAVAAGSAAARCGLLLRLSPILPLPHCRNVLKSCRHSRFGTMCASMGVHITSRTARVLTAPLPLDRLAAVAANQ